MATRATEPGEATPDLAAIYIAEVDYVWGALRRLGVREADLEDEAHDLFLLVRRRLADFDPARPVRPWLFAFAYRVASDYRRSGRSRREVLDPPAEQADDHLAGEDRLAAREAHDLILAALEDLSLDARAVFVLHDLEGYSIPEVAAALEEPLSTLYSRLRQARKLFTAAVRRLRCGGDK
ncbi:MAG: RNA polymerase sigma factor [Deltaproteobacteria bacterium]|nr:RNA polymerase sigma factor [Deltaproteobacteria bacterium]